MGGWEKRGPGIMEQPHLLLSLLGEEGKYDAQVRCESGLLAT